MVINEKAAVTTIVIYIYSDATENNNVIVMQLELSDLESVRNFCKEFLRIETSLHILVNNAGKAFLAYSLTFTQVTILCYFTSICMIFLCAYN